MARSPTGTFTLVAGNPVVTGTIITSDWANTTMPDIGAALTDSLSRTGQGGMLAPIRGVSGSATSPAHSFTDFPRSGMYAVSANEMRYAVNGVDRMRWQAGGLPTQTYNVATGLWEDLEPVGVVGPNLLDNSNFQIHQRGTGAADTGGYYVDRWTTYAKSSVGGTVSTIQPRQFGNSDPRWFLRMVNQGATSSLAYLQQAVRPERMVLGKDYTLTVSLSTLNASGNDGKLLVYGVVSGAYTVIHDETVTLTSNTDVSVTFNYTHSLDLSADDSFVAVRFQLSTGTPVVDGSTNIKSVKLEEGNVFTGYEPTPYAIDEAECMKWLYVWTTSSINTFAHSTARGYFTLEFKQQMYFTPTTVGVNQVAGSSFAISALGIQSRAPTNGAGYGLVISNGGLATCEL